MRTRKQTTEQLFTVAHYTTLQPVVAQKIITVNGRRVVEGSPAHKRALCL